jgi:hypothetical protein
VTAAEVNAATKRAHDLIVARLARAPFFVTGTLARAIAAWHFDILVRDVAAEGEACERVAVATVATDGGPWLVEQVRKAFAARGR